MEKKFKDDPMLCDPLNNIVEEEPDDFAPPVFSPEGEYEYIAPPDDETAPAD